MKQRIKLSIFWVTSFIIIIFIMCFRVHAEEPYFPMLQNNNSKFTDEVKAKIDQRFDSENNYIFCRWDSFTYNRNNIYVLWFPKSSSYTIYGEINSNGYNFTLYSSAGTFPTGQIRKIEIPNNASYINEYTGFNLSSFSGVSNLYSSSTDFISNFRIYTNNSESTVFMKYGADPNPPLDIGVAIIPPDAIVPDYPTGTTPPAQVPPTFTAADYNWTTPPTFDNSSVTNAIGSIQNTLGWIANNLKEEFKNLTNNLKGFFKYIGDTIQYYGNALLSTLNNFIQNFYDNMKSLVEPIFQKIDYITTPLEADVIWDNISGTSLITNYSSIINAASSMKSSFENLSEPTEYKIPIHLENLPSSWFGNLTTQYIDLGVINPVKTILRTFMWALITYSLFVTIIDSIANYINGGGDES